MASEKTYLRVKDNVKRSYLGFAMNSTSTGCPGDDSNAYLAYHMVAVASRTSQMTLVAIHLSKNDGRLGWPERKTRTNNLESGVRDNLGLIRLRCHAPINTNTNIYST